METSIKKALDRWVKLLNHTVSHSEDMNRFHELVYECIKEDYILTQKDIADAMKEHLKLIDAKVDKKSEEFEVRAGAIRYFVAFLKEKKGIDIKAML